jgi:hypothetical protein
MRVHEFGRPYLILSLVIWLSVALCGTMLAQSVGSGTIEGTVKDESNAILPGVTITVTSPQLLAKEVVQVSDSGGNYKFVDLPPGSYRVKAELSGFSTFIREDFLEGGHDGRVDHRERPEPCR